MFAQQNRLIQFRASFEILKFVFICDSFGFCAVIQLDLSIFFFFTFRQFCYTHLTYWSNKSKKKSSSVLINVMKTKHEINTQNFDGTATTMTKNEKQLWLWRCDENSRHATHWKMNENDVGSCTATCCFCPCGRKDTMNNWSTKKKNNVWFSQHSKRSKKRFRNEEEDAKLELTAAHTINSNRSLFECDDFAIISSKRCSDTNHHLLFSSNWEFRQRLPSFFCSRVASVSFFFFSIHQIQNDEIMVFFTVCDACWSIWTTKNQSNDCTFTW